MTTPVAKRPSISKPLFDWIKVRDPNELALRRAARTAVVMSALFAFCIEIIGSAEIATFAAFGSIALLMLVDFSGPMRARIQAEIWLSVTGAALVCLGTLTSQTVWLSVLSMAVVAIVVLFVGVVSSVLASATTSLLLVFILSTAVAGAPSTIPDRLAGWGLASLASLIALWILWPSPNRNPLRLSAAHACRALSARLNADVAHWRDDGSLNDGAYETAIQGADVATEGLHRGFSARSGGPRVSACRRGLPSVWWTRFFGWTRWSTKLVAPPSRAPRTSTIVGFVRRAPPCWMSARASWKTPLSPRHN